MFEWPLTGGKPFNRLNMKFNFIHPLVGKNIIDNPLFEVHKNL